MNRLKLIILMGFLFTMGLYAGHTTVIKKDDKVYKALGMTVEYKASAKDKNKISVIVKAHISSFLVMM